LGIITTPAWINEYLNKCVKYEKVHQVIAFLTTIEKDVKISVLKDEEKGLEDQHIESATYSS
jgi:hypothetical protein